MSDNSNVGMLDILNESSLSYSIFHTLNNYICMLLVIIFLNL